MASETIEVVFRVTDSENLTRALDKATESTKKLNAESGKLRVGSDSATKIVGKLGAAMSAAGIITNTLGGQTNELTKTFGTLASKIGTVASAFATTGPLGAALTAGAIAFDALSGAMARSKTASETAEQATRRHTAALREQKEVYEELVSTVRAYTDAQLEEAQQEGGGVRGAASSFQATAPSSLRDVVGRADQPDEFGAVLFAEQIRRNQAERARAQADERERVSRVSDARQPRRGGGAGPELTAKRRDKFTFAGEDVPEGHGEDLPDAAAQASLARKAAIENARELARSASTIGSAVAELRSRITDETNSASSTFRDSWKGSIDEVIESFRDFNRVAGETGQKSATLGTLAEKSAKQAGNAIVEHMGEKATEALRTNVDAWLEGQVSIDQAVAAIAKSVIKAVVAESIVKSIMETAEGIASLARYDFPGAAAHFTAAGTYAAVGAVAGTVGLAIGAVGGGGGAAGATAATPTARPEAPDARARDNGPTVINLYAPNLMAMDRAAQGAFMEKVLVEGRRVYTGRRAA